MTTIFDNVRLIDPASGLDRPGRLRVEGGRIVGIDESPSGAAPEVKTGSRPNTAHTSRSSAPPTRTVPDAASMAVT